MSSSIEIVSEQTEKGVYIVQFKTKMLAVFTYYVESQKQAYLIDPTYDYLVYKEFIDKRGATLKYIVLTHYHADFVSGHTEFKVPVVMGPSAKRQLNTFEIIELTDNAKFKVGSVQTRVISTPGHTMQSACFILGDETGRQFCIFTGDTVFLRQVGRPDLAVASTISAEDLAGMLFQSIQKVKALDKNLRLYPGHGSGSACGKSIGSGNFCDLKTQAEKNYAFLIEDKKEFIQKVSKDLPAPPKYFFHDAKINQQGTSVLFEESLKKARNSLTQDMIEKISSQGVTIVDTRAAIENGLIKGAHWISQKAMICQLISHVVEPQARFIIIVEEGQQVTIIERFLRIGYFNIVGFNGFNMSQWKGQLINPSLRKFDELDMNKRRVFIDVRNQNECQQTGVFQGALHIPVSQLKSRIGEVLDFIKQNQGSDVVVHCKTGMRARLAASILHNHILQPITILNQLIDTIQTKGAKLVPHKSK